MIELSEIASVDKKKISEFKLIFEEKWERNVIKKFDFLKFFGLYSILGMAPQDGFEPPAKRLTVACSTADYLGGPSDE